MSHRLQTVHFVSRAPKGATAVIDLAASVESDKKGTIDYTKTYREFSSKWRQSFVDWLGSLNIRHASKNWWAFTSGAKNILSSPLGLSFFQVLAVCKTIQQLPDATVHVVNATEGQIKTLARYFERQNINVAVARPALRMPRALVVLSRLILYVLRLIAVHMLRSRASSPGARTCLLTYVDRNFKDGFDTFFGPLAEMLADESGEMPLHLAVILGPWRNVLRRVSAANYYRYWLLFNELRFSDIIISFADTLRAWGNIKRLGYSAEAIDGIDFSPVLEEALHWDLAYGGYFFNHLIFHAARNFARRVAPQRVIYPFEMKSLEKMFIQGIREGAPDCCLIGYQHAAIAPRHTSFLLVPDECLVTPLPDFVVTIGQITRDYLEEKGRYPPGFFRVGGTLRQVQGPLLPISSVIGRPLRLLAALSSSPKELVDVATMLCALVDIRNDIEIGIRPHPEFPLSLLPKNIRYLVEDRMNDFSGTPLAENLKWCDAVVYVSSTVVLEAMTLGRPAIALSINDVIDPNPLLGNPPFRLQATSVAELVECCDQLRSWLKNEHFPEREAVVEYARNYLSPMTSTSIDAFSEIRSS